MPPPRTAAISRAPHTAPPQEADFATAAKTFALLAAPTRVRLLWLLAQGEHDVTSLAETVGATLATVSQHLAKLRLADLVTAHPDGRGQIYASTTLTSSGSSTKPYNTTRPCAATPKPVSPSKLSHP